MNASYATAEEASGRHKNYSWRGKNDDKGAQIDLVIDRNDNVINLCEIKFSSEPYLSTCLFHAQDHSITAPFLPESPESPGYPCS